MKNLLINRPIVSLITPPLKIFLTLFCLATEDLSNDGARGGDGSNCITYLDICMHFTKSVGCDCKGSHLLQLYILEMFLNPFIL